MLQAAEESGKTSVYVINRIKKDFDKEDISGSDDIVEITLEGEMRGEN